jgi:hypothetical protein
VESFIRLENVEVCDAEDSVWRSIMMIVVEFLFVDELPAQVSRQGDRGVSGLGWRLTICACTADLVILLYARSFC